LIKKKLKVKGQQPKKKVDYGAYNVGLRQVHELDEKNASHHPMDRTAKALLFFLVGYVTPKSANPTLTESLTVPSPEKAPRQNRQPSNGQK
jgi:hypothetical protein